MNLKALLRQLPTTAYVVGGAVLLLWGAWTANNYHQREIGRRDILTAQATHARDSLAKVLKAKDGQFRRDTVRIVRSIETIDTLIQHRVDTALVHQTDTVKITIREATAIQDTLRSCRSVLRECASIQSDLREMLKADTTIIQNLQKQMPGRLTPWRHRAEGAGVVIVVLKLSGLLR